jgi:chromosomal replication initiator protein
VVLARAVSTALARRLTSASYPEIARAIGRPNHSTVITAHRRLDRQMAEGMRCEQRPGEPGVLVSELLDQLASQLAPHHASTRIA